LLDQIPDMYAPVSRGAKDRRLTHYQVFTGPGTLFPSKWGVHRLSIRDGLSNTLLVIEAREPVPWTKPEDLPYDERRPLPKLGLPGRSLICAVFCDGSYHYLRADADEKDLRAIITPSGGEEVEFSRLEP